MTREESDRAYAQDLQEEYDAERMRVMRWYDYQVYHPMWVHKSLVQDYDDNLRRQEPQRQIDMAARIEKERLRKQRAKSLH